MTEPLFSVSFSGPCAFKIKSGSSSPYQVFYLFSFPPPYINRGIDTFCFKLNSNIFTFFLLCLLFLAFSASPSVCWLLSVSCTTTNVPDLQKNVALPSLSITFILPVGSSHVLVIDALINLFLLQHSDNYLLIFFRPSFYIATNVCLLLPFQNIEKEIFKIFLYTLCTVLVIWTFNNNHFL